jgi:hypothetical protein
MAHAKGLSDKAVEDILLNSDPEEIFAVITIVNQETMVSMKVKVIRKQKINSPRLVVMQQLQRRHKRWKDRSGIPHVHLLRSLLKNLFVEFLAYIVMRQDFYQTR